MPQFGQPLQHGVNRRDADAAGHQHAAGRVFVQGEVVARHADLQPLPHAQLLVHLARAAAAGAVFEHRHGVGPGLPRVDQGIAAHQTWGQVQIDVGARARGWQRGATGHRAQLEADDLGRLQAHLVNDDRKRGHAKALRVRTHMMCRPPSTMRVVPVMKEASALHSQRMGWAISVGLAQRPSKEVSLRSVRN